jgi:hypothetical protein
LVPAVLQALAVSPTRPTLTEQMLMGTYALMAPSWVVEALEVVELSPRAEEAWPKRPTALSSAVIGTLMLAIAPFWPVPTEVVEHEDLALAKMPAETEHRLIGALTLASGDFWVVFCDPEVASWLGRPMPPITLLSSVMGKLMEIGRPKSGASGFEPAVVVAAGVDLVVVTAGVDLAVVVVVVAAVFAALDAAPAPAGANPAKSAAARTTPPPMAPSVVRLFRLKMVLLCTRLSMSLLFERAALQGNGCDCPAYGLLPNSLCHKTARHLPAVPAPRC